MKSLLRSPALTLTASLALLCQIPLAYAEDKNIEVKSGDTLSTIIAEHYPASKNNKAIMQALLAANPESFKNQSVHQLIVGKTLRLPDAASIPNLQPAEPKLEATTTAGSAQADQELAELKDKLKALEADKAQLTNQVKELNAAASTQAAAAVTSTATTEAAPDPAMLMQQLDEIESANEQILADKNKLAKEQEELKQQLQTLTADKKQLEAKLAEQAAPASTNAVASPPTESAATDALDPAILMQQLDEIESANEQILADKKQLEQERDQLKQQLQTLQAGNNQVATTPIETTSTEATAASANPDAPDPAILMQQLDEIEAANEQLLTDKNKLQSDLSTAQQQLKEREQTMSALSGQITENKQQLETTQQDLLVANAARASAELNKASLEKQRGSWLPWLLALVMLPVGWLLGRRSKAPEPTNPVTSKTVTAPSAAAVSPAATDTTTAEPAQAIVTALPNVAELAQTNVAMASQTAAANDDNVDAAIKLDIVRAYLDLRDSTAASSLLKEVLREGGRQQQQEAREILSFLG